jgi:hypothetical protein
MLRYGASYGAFRIRAALCMPIGGRRDSRDAQRALDVPVTAAPLEVIEQITYLLFLRRLDDIQVLEENKAARLKMPLEHRIFPKREGPARSRLRGHALVTVSDTSPRPDVLSRRPARLPVPSHARRGWDHDAHHMKDARFHDSHGTASGEGRRSHRGSSDEDRDTKGDLCDYMQGRSLHKRSHHSYRGRVDTNCHRVLSTTPS